MSNRNFYLCPYCKGKKTIYPPKKRSALHELAGFDYSKVVLSESRVVVEVISCQEFNAVVSINDH